MFSKWDTLVALYIWHPELQYLSDKLKHIFTPKQLKKTLFQMELCIAVSEYFVAATASSTHMQTDINMHTKNYYSKLNTNQHVSLYYTMHTHELS